jgi:glycogen(starch) synthase
MAQRRLVAASDVGGHRELIRDGDTGTLFRPDDSQALARSVAGLFADRIHWEARRTRARAYVENERNWSVNVGRYDSVYQRLAKLEPMTESRSHRPVRA